MMFLIPRPLAAGQFIFDDIIKKYNKIDKKVNLFYFFDLIIRRNSPLTNTNEDFFLRSVLEGLYENRQN